MRWRNSAQTFSSSDFSETSLLRLTIELLPCLGQDELSYQPAFRLSGQSPLDR